ncbi:MAG: endonuclease/exonuclease/phosphatase family protein [Prevotella sp.]|nr:endonuclease/exonuclease/phosphatase family protein [Prevotella sp.]
MLISLLLTSWLTFVELNCENLFDWRHDEGKNDYEYLPDATRKWDSRRYWTKLNSIARTIILCGGEGEAWTLPDLVALAEVENDSVMNDLTHRSLLRNAGYEYVMTHSDDERGIDVALLYSPFTFRLISHHAIGVSPPEGRHATRDILYASGLITTGDTLHVMVVHAPSRVNGERSTRPYRLRVAERIIATIDSIRQTDSGANIIVAGDFNDYDSDSAIVRLSQHHLIHASLGAKGSHGARGTYKHRGQWGSLDHIFVSESLARRQTECHIIDAPFLTEEDEKYGGLQPRRTYVGYRYHGGSSDHLPLVLKIED